MSESAASVSVGPSIGSWSSDSLGAGGLGSFTNGCSSPAISS